MPPYSPTVAPPLSPLPFHYTRRPREVDASADMPSTSGVSSSVPEPPHNLRARPLPAPDRYSPTHYGLSAALSPLLTGMLLLIPNGS